MKVVGVTACPTGVAHTYMAQEALEKECLKRGFEVKVETQGSIGIENELEQDEVDAADIVVMAVAVILEGEERFEDALIFETDINELIAKPEKVIDKMLEFYEENK